MRKDNPTLWLGVGVLLLFVGNYVLLNQIVSIIGAVSFLYGVWLFYKKSKRNS